MSLVVQGLRIHLPMQGAGSIPGQGTKIPHAVGQLSLSTAMREAYVVQVEKSPRAVMKSQCSQNKNN